MAQGDQPAPVREEGLPLAMAGRAPVNLRSFLIGTAAVIVTSALPTYNDHVVANTFFIGSYLPLALVLLMFVLVVLANSLLRRFVPGQAFSSGELAVIFLMQMIACSLASQGLFRYFMPMIIGPFHHGSTDTRLWKAFVHAGLPDWLFPASIADGPNSPVISQFIGRVQADEAIPFGAWVRPLAVWGIFIAGWFATLVSTVWIFRRQWSENERLPFPIAGIEAALIAEPRPGRVLNDLLGSRLFWTGVIVVFLLHSDVALNKYFPTAVPLVPLKYNLTNVMTERPWMDFSGYVKSATIYFTYIGMAYFIQSRISFSLWSLFLLGQIATAQAKFYSSDITLEAWRDQHVGACVVYTLGFLWIGRHHIAAVWRQLVNRPGNTALTRNENYRIPAMVLLGGLAVMATWLMVVQVQWWVIIFILGMVLITHIATARIVAETGMPFCRVDLVPGQLFSNIGTQMVTGKDMYISSTVYSISAIATRESCAVFAQQGFVLADRSGADTGKHARKLFALVAFSFVLSFVVCSASYLWTHYTYATPISGYSQQPYLDQPAMDRPKPEMLEPMARQVDGSYPTKPYSPRLHFSIGVGITTVLQVMALRFGSWPFLPVGYLLCSSWAISMAWFSLFLGWLAKVLILRFGGASMYQKARPIFVGLIFGEALAAGIWMLISLVLAWSGCDYKAITVLPS